MAFNLLNKTANVWELVFWQMSTPLAMEIMLN